MTRSSLKQFIFQVLILALLIGACSSSPNLDATATNQVLVSDYPGSQIPAATSPSSGYPFGTAEIPQLAPTLQPSPTIDPILGQVRGALLLRGQPIVNYHVYLAELLKSEVGEDGIIALDLVTSPRGYTDDDGSFHIVNVAPGQYGLVIITAKDSYHLHYPNRAESVLVTVTERGQIDLGKLDYQDLPISNP